MNGNLRPESMGTIFLLCLVVGTLWTWRDPVLGTHIVEFILWSLTLGAMIFALLCVVYAALGGRRRSVDTRD